MADKFALIDLVNSKKRVKVDRDCLPVLSKHQWRLNENEGLVETYVYGNRLRLRNLVCGAKKGHRVLHLNGNKLDCRSENMKLVKESVIQQNAKISNPSKSGYIGVLERNYGQKNRYSAIIKYQNENLWLGSYGTKIEAAWAYDFAAVVLHGKYAKFNFLKESN